MVVNKQFRDWRECKRGIPQGTVSDSVLFSLYINDLFKFNTNKNEIGYVDDTVTFLKSGNWLTLIEELGEHFIQITDWFEVNINME